MPLEGRISVDVGFTDTDSSGGAQSLKRISLMEATSYTTGKVAVVTGTAGTAATTVAATLSLPYRDASGNLVSFSEVRRVAFAYSGSVARSLNETQDSAFSIVSAEGRVAISECVLPGVSLQLGVSVGTGTYTIVLYGT
jgi:hypothetical protein